MPVIAAAIGALLDPRDAPAQDVISRFSVRAELGAGLVLPALQRESLGYDTAHVQVTGRVGFDVVDWLSLQVSLNNGFFVAREQLATGRTLAVQLGLRLQPAVGALGRAWGDLNPGYYSTGTDRRFGLDAGLGFEFNAARALALGPFARVHWIPADTAIHEASDATYLSFGVSLSLRVPPPPVAPVVLDRDGDGVPDGGDRCPSTPQGSRPDAARRGCPVLDADADGVLDGDDQCVNVPVGAHPDPARRGCPVVDQDNDGVLDDDDVCPTTPTGSTPDAARRGCPSVDQDGDGVFDADDTCPTVPAGAMRDPARLGCPMGDHDRDHDGIADDADRCPDQAETFNGRDDADGCPDGATLGARSGGRIRISEQIRFRTDSAEIHGRRSFAVIDAVAGILRASPDIVMLHVEGHTDDRGDAGHNRELSNQRAAAVIRELVARGVAASRLTAHGYGPDRPIATGHSRRDRNANRRIDFRADLDNTAAPTERTHGP